MDRAAREYPHRPMQRVNVVGTSCSGKTTLARRLAARLGVRHVELDALFWGPAWRPMPHEVFRQRVSDATDAPAWVVDGGYSTVRDVTWSRADTVVWLDYPLPLVLARYLRRTVRRLRSGEEFWPGTGNRETMGTFSRATRCCGGSSRRTAGAGVASPTRCATNRT